MISNDFRIPPLRFPDAYEAYSSREPFSCSMHHLPMIATSLQYPASNPAEMLSFSLFNAVDPLSSVDAACISSFVLPGTARSFRSFPVLPRRLDSSWPFPQRHLYFDGHPRGFFYDLGNSFSSLNPEPILPLLGMSSGFEGRTQEITICHGKIWRWAEDNGILIHKFDERGDVATVVPENFFEFQDKSVDQVGECSVVHYSPQNVIRKYEVSVPLRREFEPEEDIIADSDEEEEREEETEQRIWCDEYDLTKEKITHRYGQFLGQEEVGDSVRFEISKRHVLNSFNKPLILAFESHETRRGRMWTKANYWIHGEADDETTKLPLLGHRFSFVHVVSPTSIVVTSSSSFMSQFDLRKISSDESGNAIPVFRYNFDTITSECLLTTLFEAESVVLKGEIQEYSNTTGNEMCLGTRISRLDLKSQEKTIIVDLPQGVSVVGATPIEECFECISRPWAFSSHMEEAEGIREARLSGAASNGFEEEDEESVSVFDERRESFPPFCALTEFGHLLVFEQLKLRSRIDVDRALTEFFSFGAKVSWNESRAMWWDAGTNTLILKLGSRRSDGPNRPTYCLGIDLNDDSIGWVRMFEVSVTLQMLSFAVMAILRDGSGAILLNIQNGEGICRYCGIRGEALKMTTSNPRTDSFFVVVSGSSNLRSVINQSPESEDETWKRNNLIEPVILPDIDSDDDEEEEEEFEDECFSDEEDLHSSNDDDDDEEEEEAPLLDSVWFLRDDEEMGREDLRRIVEFSISGETFEMKQTRSWMGLWDETKLLLATSDFLFVRSLDSETYKSTIHAYRHDSSHSIWSTGQGPSDLELFLTWRDASSDCPDFMVINSNELYGRGICLRSHCAGLIGPLAAVFTEDRDGTELYLIGRNSMSGGVVVASSMDQETRSVKRHEIAVTEEIHLLCACQSLDPILSTRPRVITENDSLFYDFMGVSMTVQEDEGRGWKNRLEQLALKSEDSLSSAIQDRRFSYEDIRSGHWKHEFEDPKLLIASLFSGRFVGIRNGTCAIACSVDAVRRFCPMSPTLKRRMQDVGLLPNVVSPSRDNVEQERRDFVSLKSPFDPTMVPVDFHEIRNSLLSGMRFGLSTSSVFENVVDWFVDWDGGDCMESRRNLDQVSGEMVSSEVEQPFVRAEMLSSQLWEAFAPDDALLTLPSNVVNYARFCYLKRQLRQDCAIPVSLCISRLNEGRNLGAVTRALGTVGRFLGLRGAQFGLAHAFPTLGSLELHWSNDSRVSLSLEKRPNVVVQLQLAMITDLLELGTIATDLSRLIVFCNGKVLYNVQGNRKLGYHNCQTFSLEVLRTVVGGFECVVPSIVQEYLTEILPSIIADDSSDSARRLPLHGIRLGTKAGFDDLFPEVVPRVLRLRDGMVVKRKTFSRATSWVQFASSEEVKEFMKALVEKYLDFPIRFAGEWALLKGFENENGDARLRVHRINLNASEEGSGVWRLPESMLKHWTRFE